MAAAPHAYPGSNSRRSAPGESRRDSTRRRKPGAGSTCIIVRTARSIARSSGDLCEPVQGESLFIGISERGQFLLQHAPGFRDAPFDRAERGSEHLADLFVRVFTGPGEHTYEQISQM